MNKVLEILGQPTFASPSPNWKKVVANRWYPFLDRLCLKNRKSHPEILIGTCCVAYGKNQEGVIICPHRLLERRQIFTDCIHLLTLHEPGNEFHIIPEITITGGSVDYFLASVRKGKVRDFVGIELQTMDTTGTVWPERQRFLSSVNIKSDEPVDSTKSFGMNWKMTAKTILVQLHHKIETFENINKRLVLVVQDRLLSYMQNNFNFGHINDARIGDAMHFHAYRLNHESTRLQIELVKRMSTDAAGISQCLGLHSSGKMDLNLIIEMLETKISKMTLFNFGPISDQTPATKPS